MAQGMNVKTLYQVKPGASADTIKLAVEAARNGLINAAPGDTAFIEFQDGKSYQIHRGEDHSQCNNLTNILIRQYADKEDQVKATGVAKR